MDPRIIQFIRQIFGPDVQIQEVAATPLNMTQTFFPDSEELPDEHPIYNIVPTYRDDYPGPPRMVFIHPRFPGYTLLDIEDWNNFHKHMSFYPAVTGPQNQDDLLGNTYSECDHVYALMLPRNPNTVQFYSSEELVATFLNYSNFTNPKDVNRIFGRPQIDRLELLTQEVNDPLLHNTILAIKELQVQLEDIETGLEKEPYYQECLKLIFECAMYMRGWSGRGKYPLQKPRKRINENVLLESLWKLRSMLEDEWKPMRDLKMVRPVEGIWRVDEKAPTLYERLELVLRTDRPESCIRATSNIFAYSSWYFSKKDDRPFKLKEFRRLV